ncbi:MAG: hypothetical protein WAK91_12310 [Candidatus Acidiferrales bacterium]
MLTINCIFDEESEPDGMDPLGNLVLSDGLSRIVFETTYLDSWLASLIEAVSELRTRSQVGVEIEEEPHAIEIDATADGHLTISYEKQKIAAEGSKELELALRAAVTPFLDILTNSPEASQNRFIDSIRRFWVTTKN